MEPPDLKVGILLFADHFQIQSSKKSEVQAVAQGLEKPIFSVAILQPSARYTTPASGTVCCRSCGPVCAG